MSTPPSLYFRFHAPTTPLSINRYKSLHWNTRRRLLDPWRDMAIVMARKPDGRNWARLHGPVPVTIAVELPFRGRIRRDAHNYTGTVVKAVVDGLVQGGLIPDDTPEWATVSDPTISIQPDKSRPLLATVTITPRSSP